MIKIHSIKAIAKIAFIAMCFMLLLLGCEKERLGTNPIYEEPSMGKEDVPVNSLESEVSQQYPKENKQTVTLSAVGDIMFHSYQLQRAYHTENDRFDFSASFEPVRDVLEQADYTVANLETVLAGKGEGNEEQATIGGYSGYPRFNSPDVVVDSLLEAGVDLVSTANNHALDQGIKGLLRTIDVCDQKGLSHIGTYKDAQHRQSYKRVRLKGMTFAFINYTYGTNTSLTDHMDEHINTLHHYNLNAYDEMINAVKDAKKEPVDFIVVMMHYGDEYQPTPNQNQIALNDLLMDTGADIILGGHPHTLQPIEVYTSWKGVPLESPKLVIYSLGNFLASQRNVEQFEADTDIGVILTLHFEKGGMKAPRLIGFDVLPTFTHWQADAIMTLPVHEKLLEQSPYALTDWDKKRLRYAMENTSKFLTQDVHNVVRQTAFDEDGTYHYNIEENNQ